MRLRTCLRMRFQMILLQCVILKKPCGRFSAVFPKQIWRSRGGGSRNLDQPKGDETHLKMKTTADWYFLCMFFTKNLAYLL